MQKKLVFIGGGHAHMVSLAKLATIIGQGHSVTVIGPSAYHYYSGMGPGMLSGTYRPEEVRFATRHVVESQGGIFLPGQAIAIDPEQKVVILENGTRVPYDVLSCNAGSYVPRPAIDGNHADIFTVKPIERLMQAQQRLVDHFGRHSPQVVIVGGGPSAAEVAGNVWQLGTTTAKHMPHITICAGRTFMDGLPASVRRRIAVVLERRGVTIREGAYVDAITASGVLLRDGQNLPADFIFLALGVKPSTIFADSGIAIGPDGGLRVNRYLQSTEYPDIFGGGDCIHFEEQPLDKVGVYAVRQNEILFHNIVARLNGDELMPFDPGGGYLLIFNLGGGIGVLKKGWLEFGGRPAFLIKDTIDRRFMNKFQAIE